MASIHIQPAHLYRGLYREIRRVKAIGQGSSPDFAGMLREGFKATPSNAGATQAHPGSSAHVKALYDASEILLFLRSQRTYTELLERYNPGATMTQAERNRLTARRVGLNLPKDNSDDFFNKK